MLFNCQLAQRKQLMLSLKAFSIQARYSTSSATLSTSSLFWVKLLAKQARRTRAHLSLSWALTAWKGCISHRGFPKGFPIGAVWSATLSGHSDSVLLRLVCKLVGERANSQSADTHYSMVGARVCHWEWLCCGWSGWLRQSAMTPSNMFHMFIY